MEDKKLTFIKRIQLTKKECFENLQHVDLDKTANKKSGYYGLKSILTELNPLLDKYELDLDLSIKENEVVAVWYDCIDDKSRTSIVDISKIKDVKRLPSMTNEVQSMGACISYVRRYTYTVVLGLNATDLIETNTNNNANYKSNNNSNNNKIQKNTTKDTIKIISMEQMILLKLKGILNTIAKGDKTRVDQLLRLATSFKNKEGIQIEGVDKFSELSPERARVIYGQYKTSNPDIVASVKEKLLKFYKIEE